jgi:ABC-type cobalamin/Fe3+-siderophores transport system ATPase subunit
MFDSTRIRGELTHIHKTLATLTVGAAGRGLAEELRAAIGATIAATIWGALFADCLRVVHCAASADGEILEEEVEALYELTYSIAHCYAGLLPDTYREFEVIGHDDVRRFLSCYAEDVGPFGRGAPEHWPGLVLCRRAAELGEGGALERYERLMSWLIAEACQVGKVGENEQRWKEKIAELHELREALAMSSNVIEPDVDLRVQAFLSGKRVFSSVQQASSIYEDDPFDVEAIHADVRETFAELLDRANAPEQDRGGGRMFLVLGDSGSGKTHLLRGLRHYVHEYRRGFVVYAQMSSTTDDYPRYLLQHVVDSLSHSYSGPRGDRSGLVELAHGLCEIGGEHLEEKLQRLYDDEWKSPEEADAHIVGLVDDLLLHEELATVDPALLHVLLSSLRPDSRVTSRVYKYLRCEELSPHDRKWIGGVASRAGKDAPQRMILSLGRVAYATRRAALVLMIDQMEQSIFDDSSGIAFRSAIDTLNALVENLPSAIAVIACLKDLYTAVKPSLTKFILDRLDDPKSVVLGVRRTYDEIESMVGRRLSWLFAEANAVYRPEAPIYPFPEDWMRSLEGSRTRDVLARCHRFQLECAAAGKIVEQPTEDHLPPPVAGQAMDLDKIGAAWNDALHGGGIEVPDDDQQILAVVAAAAKSCAEEVGASVVGTPVLNGTLRISLAKAAERVELSIGVTNNSFHRGSFGRQIETLRKEAKKAVPVAVRTSPFPRGPASDKTIAGLLKGGGRAEELDESALRALVAFQRFQPAATPAKVSEWLRRDRPLSGIPVISRIFDLERLKADPEPALLSPEVAPAHAAPQEIQKPTVRPESTSREPVREISPRAEKVNGSEMVKPARNGRRPGQRDPKAVSTAAATAPDGKVQSRRKKEPGSLETSAAEEEPEQDPGGDEEVQMSSALLVGTSVGFRTEPHHLETSELLRHTGVLGSSGSGKTTLALNLIEQVLERNVAVVMLDRKGDLAGYARPDWWQLTDDPARARRLAEQIDVRLFTPGNRGGRPLSLSVIPDLTSVPEHERDRMIRYSAQALGSMMRIGSSPSDSARMAILMQAISLLAERNAQAGIVDLIAMLESRDDALLARARLYDDKLFKRLLQDLETVRLSDAELFDDSAEKLSIETLIGRKADGKVPLAIVSTRFLGDVERIQSWVAHLLACLNRHLAKAPSVELHTILMIDEADMYLPAGAEKPATKEPLQDLLKRARAGGLGVMLASQSPGDLDYRSREQINTWFLGKIADRRSIEKMRPLFESKPAVGGKLGQLEMGRFVMLQEGGTADLERKPSMLRTDQLVESDLMSLARRGRELAAELLA